MSTGSQFEPVYRNVYLPKGRELTPVTRAKAAWLWASREATLAGLPASAMHGSLWIDPAEPAELIRRGDEVDGILIHRDKLVDDEICPGQHARDIDRLAELQAAGWIIIR